MAGNNEITIEARLGTSKLESDARRGASVINQIFGSGQAQAGSRPATPMSATSPVGGSLSDELAKQQSKAKVDRYTSGLTSGSNYGGLGGGGEINASGTRAFQINKAVIHIQNAKIHASRRGGMPSGGGELGMPAPGSHVDQPTPGGGDTNTHIKQTKLAEAGSKFRSGAMVGESLGGGTSLTHLFNLGMDTTGIAYRNIQARGSASSTGSHGAAPSHAPSGHVEDKSAHDIAATNKEMGSRLTSAGAAVPFIGVAVGAAVAAGQRLGEAYVSKLTSQLPTIGQTGDMAAGGIGGIGRLGYSAAAKGQMVMQAQMNMTGTGYTESGGINANRREALFGKAASFGHGQGIGAGQGMVLAAKIQEMNEVSSHRKTSGSYISASNDLLKIGGYGYGFGGRRMGQFAQMAVGLGEQQAASGGVGDATAIAQSMSRLTGHTTLAGAHHTISQLSGMMSAGSGSGSAISGLLMMAEAGRGGDWKSVLKAADKGFTKGGMADLKSMLPKEMLEIVMYGETGGKMTAAEHLTEAIHGKDSFKAIGSDRSMGFSVGGKGDPRLEAANKYAFQMEQLADAGARFAEIIHRVNGSLAKLGVGFDKFLKRIGL